MTSPHAQPFDLGAAAAASRGESWAFTFGGRTFEVAADLPLDLLEAYAAFAGAQIDEADEGAGLRAAAAMAPLLASLGSLFATDEDYAAFRSMRPGQAELTALLGELTRRQTGGSLGEPLAPSSSSADGSARPKLTSAGSTA